VLEVTQPKLVHLSYRMRNKIYWTRKTIALHKGEKLISDGKMTARTRCANQVSEQAKGDTSPEEPPIALLERPMDGDGGTATQIPIPNKFADGLSARPGLPPIGGGSGPSGSGLFSPGIGGGYAPIASPGIPQNPHGFHPSTPVPGPPLPPPPPPPPAVPEPGTLLLVGSGITGIYWKYRGKCKS
jgi:hypothetical protein